MAQNYKKINNKDSNKLLSNKQGYAEILAEARRLEFEYCKSNFLYFASHYCVIEDKDADPVIQPFTPWEGQKELIEQIRRHKLVCILKARQLGITWIAIYWALWAIIFHPGKTVIALSKTEEDSKEIIRRAALVLDNLPSLLQGGGITYVKTAMQIIVNYGDSKVQGWFKSFTASESSGRSFTANILLLDEWAYQQYAEEIWASTFPTINRPGGGQVIGLSTIKRGTLFEDIIAGAPGNGFKLCFLPWWTDPRRTKEWYAKTELAIGIAKTRQEYPASIEEALSNAEGAMFKTFSRSKNVCEPFIIPDHWRQYTTMDYGYDMFAYYNIAVDEDGEVYVWREIHQPELDVMQAVAKIKDMESNDKGKPTARYAPQDLWNRQSAAAGKSTAILFYESGLSLTPASRDFESGCNALRTLLPRLHIFDNCVNLIACLEAIQVDEKDPNIYAKKPHKYTHAVDALRYFAISWTRPAEPVLGKRVKWREDMWEDYWNADNAGRSYLINKWGEPC